MADAAPRKPPPAPEQGTADTTPEGKESLAEDGSEASLFGQFDVMIEALLGPPPSSAASAAEPADPPSS